MSGRALDPDEPANLARAVARLELEYVVITSVDRDDLPDFGAGVFAETVRAIRAVRPECRVEVLIPDFQGREASLRTVLDARPDILNHNTETVPRLYRLARPGGRYARALELLDRARRIRPDIPTKTGLMVGLLAIILIGGWDGWLVAAGSADRIEFWEGNLFFYSDSKSRLAEADEVFTKFDCPRTLA